MHPDISSSTKAVDIMNSMMNDVEPLATEATQLAQYFSKPGSPDSHVSTVTQELAIHHVSGYKGCHQVHQLQVTQGLTLIKGELLKKNVCVYSKNVLNTKTYILQRTGIKLEGSLNLIVASFHRFAFWFLFVIAYLG